MVKNKDEKSKYSHTTVAADDPRDYTNLRNKIVIVPQNYYESPFNFERNHVPPNKASLNKPGYQPKIFAFLYVGTAIWKMNNDFYVCDSENACFFNDVKGTPAGHPLYDRAFQKLSADCIKKQ